MKRERCECGRTRSRHATRCRGCERRHYDDLHEKARAQVATGKCPDCGSPLRRNLSLTGWWQCSQLGADGFRADSSKPACGFQTFTE